MKKVKIIFLILFTFFILTSFFINDLNNNLRNVEEKAKTYNIKTPKNRVNNLKTSKSWKTIKFIHITGVNWSDTANDYEWCNGSGTPIDPYIIENITIDGGGSGSGILIENSTAYFRIENCTVYNSGSPLIITTTFFDAGIKLVNVSNGNLINNTLSFNNKKGIVLDNCHNNTISNNTFNNNDSGIYLLNSDNNTITGNIANDNTNYGVILSDNNHNNTIMGNTANNNNYGISIYRTSSKNNVLRNTANNNNHDGIVLGFQCYDNNVSGNIVSYNSIHGLSLWDSHRNNISQNTANNNKYGIFLWRSNNTNISQNTAINNTYGIYLWHSNHNNISQNSLIGNILFIEVFKGINNLIKKDNICYTKIIPSGIHRLEIEPFGVDKIDVGIVIALDHETEVVFSSFKNNILEYSLDNGLIYINLQLNDTNNLNQSIKAPINITLRFDIYKYETIEAHWYDQSANDDQGAWVTIHFTDLGNGLILISVNHTSIFVISGVLKLIPLSTNSENDVKRVDDIKIIYILILAVLICSLIIITASSIYYFEPKNQTKTKVSKKKMLMKKSLLKNSAKKLVKSPNLGDYVKNKNLLKILENKNALKNPILFRDLKFNTISNEFWEKIDKLELDEYDIKDFINDMLSLTPEEREEIINGMIKFRDLDSNYSN